MKALTGRIIAALLLVVPGLAATYGFLLMKDAFFAQFGAPETDPHIDWVRLILGFLLFAIGVTFIGGWTFYRDRKRNYVAPRFRANRKNRR